VAGPKPSLTFASMLHHIASWQESYTVSRALLPPGRWPPSKQFLYDFVAQSQPKLASLTAPQAAGVMWAFAQ